MTAVILSWDDPEDAAEFRRIRRALRDGFAWDADREHLLELVAASEAAEDRGDESSP